MNEVEPADREVLDLDDPEQLAEAVVLGAVQSFEISSARLARLGQAYTELLAQRRAADAADQAVAREIAQLRAINANFRSLITSGELRQMNGAVPLTGLQATEVLFVAAHALAPDRHGVIGLALSVAVNACLNAEFPRGALQAAVEIFEAARLDVDQAAAAAAAEPTQEPS